MGDSISRKYYFVSKYILKQNILKTDLEQKKCWYNLELCLYLYCFIIRTRYQKVSIWMEWQLVDRSRVYRIVLPQVGLSDIIYLYTIVRIANTNTFVIRMEFYMIRYSWNRQSFCCFIDWNSMNRLK